MYMSYCRFEGTRSELRACMSDVDEHVNEEAEYAVSYREIAEFKMMVNEFVEFLREHDLIDEYGEVDGDQLDQICSAMEKGQEDYE